MRQQPITIQQVRSHQKRAKPTNSSELGFGKYFSDHMFKLDFCRADGWNHARIEPNQALQLDPAALCLHYGQMVFEGLKAYRGKDGGIYLFRWQKNAERMFNSCKRLVAETIDEQLFGRAVKALTLVDRDWIPQDPSCSLYIRPTLIATDPFLGVHPGDEYLFYIITGPVGAYYPEGFRPVSICVCEDEVRAVRGGLGEAKTAANYAASLSAQKKAASKGFSQVLWLDAVERRYIEEVGTMNIFFVIKDELVTAPLAGTILPGVTRDSVIQLAKHWGMKVNERRLAMDEIVETAANGTLQEAFGTGTAAVIAPVGTLFYKDKLLIDRKDKVGPIAQRLYDYLTRMQHAEEADPFNWVERIDQLDLNQLLQG